MDDLMFAPRSCFDIRRPIAPNSSLSVRSPPPDAMDRDHRPRLRPVISAVHCRSTAPCGAIGRARAADRPLPPLPAALRPHPGGIAAHEDHVGLWALDLGQLAEQSGRNPENNRAPGRRSG
jgi:hypothetical protein